MTKPAENREERQAEEVISQVLLSMKAIAEKKPPITTSLEEIEEVVKNLTQRKPKIRIHGITS